MKKMWNPCRHSVSADLWYEVQRKNYVFIPMRASGWSRMVQDG